MLKLLADGIISESAVSYVDDLKMRLNYELKLIVSLKSESHLRLSFEVTIIYCYLFFSLVF